MTVTAAITGVARRAPRTRAVHRDAVLRGRPEHVRLAFRRADGAAIAPALRAGRRVRARVTVRASGFAGPARSLRRVVRVAR
jgi:hypothetical protein